MVPTHPMVDGDVFIIKTCRGGVFLREEKPSPNPLFLLLWVVSVVGVVGDDADPLAAVTRVENNFKPRTNH